MLQLQNSTPFPGQICLFPNESGIDTLYVMIKATFTLGERLALSDEQCPPVAADEYWDEPTNSSPRYVSEYHLSKPATDIIVVGQAWPADGRKATQLDTFLRVGRSEKTLRVFGDREWQSDGNRISPPQPFESMPLVYERAYGGLDLTHADEDTPPPGEARNPVGIGFLGDRKPRELAGQPVPNIEDPVQLMRQAGDSPPPAGLGCIAPTWQPRLGFAGTYDEAWQTGRAPYLPDDFDLRFFNAAHPDLIADGYLQGGEPVEATNLSAQGPLRFTLPVCSFSLTARVAGGIKTLQVKLETVLLEPDEDRLCMLWRAEQSCDKEALKIEEVRVDMQELKLA